MNFALPNGAMRNLSFTCGRCPRQHSPLTFWLANIRACARMIDDRQAVFLLVWTDREGFCSNLAATCVESGFRPPSDHEMAACWGEWRDALAYRVLEIIQSTRAMTG